MATATISENIHGESIEALRYRERDWEGMYRIVQSMRGHRSGKHV